MILCKQYLCMARKVDSSASCGMGLNDLTQDGQGNLSIFTMEIILIQSSQNSLSLSVRAHSVPALPHGHDESKT